MMKRVLTVVALILVIFTAGCSNMVQPNAPGASDPTATGATPVTVRLPVGYIPNIQFAPLYAAIENGYYRDEGLDVQIDYSMENDNAVLLGSNDIQFAILSGEQVLLGRGQQLPLVYIMDWYQQYPVGVVSKVGANIKQPTDLKGKHIGLPGTFGASYIGLIALLDAAGLSEQDVSLDSIGFNQVEVLTADRDDAVVIYVANEPNVLASQGVNVNLIKVSDYSSLVGNGLVTNETTLANNPELVQKMVTATLKGIQYVIDNPDAAFDLSMKYVENLANSDQALQKKVLADSISEWQGAHLGQSDPASWENMQRILIKMGLQANQLDLGKAYSNQFVP